MKVIVREPFSVTYDGVSYGPGESVDVVESVADLWVRSGWVDPAPETVTKPVEPTDVSTAEVKR